MWPTTLLRVRKDLPRRAVPRQAVRQAPEVPRVRIRRRYLLRGREGGLDAVKDVLKGDYIAFKHYSESWMSL